MVFSLIEDRQIGSVSGYARHRGVSQAAVSQFISSGRLREAIIEKGKGKYEIDFELADRELAANTIKPLGNTSNATSYARSRAVREAYTAQLSKLDYEQRANDLVMAADVRYQAYLQTQRLRTLIQSIPGRVAATLAAELDEIRIKQYLDRELRAMLAEFLGD